MFNQSRNINKFTAKRHKIKLLKDASITSSIEPTFDAEFIISPHCLLYLTLTEWKRCKDNYIIVTGLFASNITSYNNVIISDNIKDPLKRATKNCSLVHWREVNLSDIIGGM